VVGSGAAGIAAAVTAARAGRATLLMDQRPAAGGTGGHSGLTTLCGLYDDTGAVLNDGFPREFAEALAETKPVRMGRLWVLPYRPGRFRALAAELVGGVPGLQAHWNTPLSRVLTDRNRIVQLNEVRVKAVIDCTGFAEVARLAGVECLATDETTQAPAVVFSLSEVTRPVDTPAAAARVLLPLARAGLPPLSFQPHPEPGTITIKFSGRADQVPGVVEFLRRHVDGFQRCHADRADPTPARRAGRMIPGEYLLTGADVLAGRKFSDAAARCAWPIEQWGPDGQIRLRYLSAGAHYEIPARSLRSRSLENLFMAGKTISADVDAIASARVMGCCLATGAAAGQLAAHALACACET